MDLTLIHMLMAGSLSRLTFSLVRPPMDHTSSLKRIGIINKTYDWPDIDLEYIVSLTHFKHCKSLSTLTGK